MAAKRGLTAGPLFAWLRLFLAAATVFAFAAIFAAATVFTLATVFALAAVLAFATVFALATVLAAFRFAFAAVLALTAIFAFTTVFTAVVLLGIATVFALTAVFFGLVPAVVLSGSRGRSCYYAGHCGRHKFRKLSSVHLKLLQSVRLPHRLKDRPSGANQHPESLLLSLVLQTLSDRCSSGDPPSQTINSTTRPPPEKFPLGEKFCRIPSIMASQRTPYFQIRANFNRDTIVVYQAYNCQIADAALAANRFVPPFSVQRATWIKPSFLWLMERSGWGQKSNQQRTLAVRITRKGLGKALSLSVLTHPERAADGWEEEIKSAPVIVQWDPERTLRGEKLEHRSIQVGLRRQIVEEFVNEWIVDIQDLTGLVKKIAAYRKAGQYEKARRLLPPEKVYPLPGELQQRLGMSREGL